MWAGLTIGWIFAPFLYSLPSIFRDRTNETLTNLAVHFPMMIPVKNIFHAGQLARINYDKPMSVEALNKKEEIQQTSGRLTFKEAFLVSFFNTPSFSQYIL